ncbi:ribosome maturation factor RimM [Buchnera aphidicola]|uniref:Ribosome maturation factor RimM n=1 Tax=Buchnera aphidicola (Anoecia oenotherae) TaxID=1241833 RepID=A0A4D6XPZ5_9GAMM|nr:ribosome maturation factor RimM [Buchnera aphidicola]QCI19432.1 16S rRNA processing protein RimM [Buchnera aphidicola (Anoecia oenotherae)]
MIIVKNKYFKTSNETIIVGKVGKPYGILGWIYLISFTEKKENIFSYFPWFIKGKKIINVKWKKHKQRYICSVDKINDRNSISIFTNENIVINESTLPNLSNNELYWKDVINCHVFSIQNIYIGKVIDLIDNTFYDLLVVKNKYFKKSKVITLIPFIEIKIIKKIDLINKNIIVDYNLSL